MALLVDICHSDQAVRFQKPIPFPISSLSHGFGSGCESSATTSCNAYLPVAKLSFMIAMYSNSGTMHPKLNSLFYKLHWSWELPTVINM